jgi:hypothetical protein
MQETCTKSRAESFNFHSHFAVAGKDYSLSFPYFCALDEVFDVT